MILHYQIKRQVILFSWNFKVDSFSSISSQKWNGFLCVMAVPGEGEEYPAHWPGLERQLKSRPSDLAGLYIENSGLK